MSNDSADNIEKDLAALSKPAIERVCLSCILSNPELIVDAELGVKKDDFTVPHHKIMYEIMSRLFEAAVRNKQAVVFDTIAILDHIKVLGIQDEYLNSSNAFTYIESLRTIADFTDKEKFDYYLNILRESSAKRQLYLDTIKIKSEIMQDLGQSADKLLVQAENRILNTHLNASSLSSKLIQIGKGLKDYITNLFGAPKDLAGIPTGYKELDRKLSGLRPGSLTILAAKYKGGKSALLGNLAFNIAKQNIPVLMISTEMEDIEIQTRLLGNIADVDIRKIETGQCSEEEKNKVMQAAHYMEGLPFEHLHILDFTPEKLISLMRKFVYHKVGFDENKKANPCVILFDYLKMPEMNRDSWVETEWQALGVFCTALKNTASELGVPIFTAAQLNEQGGVAASSRLKWYATALIRFVSYEDELSDKQKATMDAEQYLNIYRLRIEFNRHGPENRLGIGFRWFKDRMQIVEDPLITFSE